MFVPFDGVISFCCERGKIGGVGVLIGVITVQMTNIEMVGCGELK